MTISWLIPFNVDGVDAKNKFLAEDPRLPFGAPLTGKGTIGNANYLWIQYFCPTSTILAEPVL